jgi:hypothetical protein
MEQQNQNKIFKLIPWMLFFVVVVVGCFAYFSVYNWEIIETLGAGLSIFPLLGILAWSIMWTHFAYGALRIKYRLPKNKVYSVISGWIVLFLILLHPGILALEMYRSTELLPPKSILLYTGDSFLWAVVLAEVALLTFLSFEVFNRIKEKTAIKNNWIWISLSQMMAMTFIFIHSMALGHDLKIGWFRIYWIVLFAILVPCFILILKAELRSKKVINQNPQQTTDSLDNKISQN